LRRKRIEFALHGGDFLLVLRLRARFFGRFNASVAFASSRSAPRIAVSASTVMSWG
jgi:hypothetical protein